MSSLNVALTAPFSGAVLLADAGFVRVMVGAVVLAPAPVVKLQTKFAARAFPVRSSAAVVMVAVYCLVAARGLLGLNVTVLPA